MNSREIVLFSPSTYRITQVQYYYYSMDGNYPTDTERIIKLFFIITHTLIYIRIIFLHVKKKRVYNQFYTFQTLLLFITKCASSLYVYDH